MHYFNWLTLYEREHTIQYMSIKIGFLLKLTKNVTKNHYF